MAVALGLVGQAFAGGETAVRLVSVDVRAGAPVPPGFVAVMQAAATPEANGTAELEGRVAVRAPVQGGSLTVVAVRKLPDVARPQAFDGVEAALERLTAMATTMCLAPPPPPEPTVKPSGKSTAKPSGSASASPSK